MAERDWPDHDPRPLDEALDELETHHRAARRLTDEEQSAVDLMRQRLRGQRKRAGQLPVDGAS